MRPRGTVASVDRRSRGAAGTRVTPPHRAGPRIRLRSGTGHRQCARGCGNPRAACPARDGLPVGVVVSPGDRARSRRLCRRGGRPAEQRRSPAPVGRAHLSTRPRPSAARLEACPPGIAPRPRHSVRRPNALCTAADPCAGRAGIVVRSTAPRADRGIARPARDVLVDLFTRRRHGGGCRVRREVPSDGGRARRRHRRRMDGAPRRSGGAEDGRELGRTGGRDRA